MEIGIIGSILREKILFRFLTKRVTRRVFSPRWFEVGCGRNRRKEVKRLALRSPRVPPPPPLLLCTYVFTRPSRESVNYSVQKPVYIVTLVARELIYLSAKKRREGKKREAIFQAAILRYSITR